LKKKKKGGWSHSLSIWEWPNHSHFPSCYLRVVEPLQRPCGWFGHPYLFFKCFFLIIIIIIIFFLIFSLLVLFFFLIIHRNTCQFFKACDMDFRQFLDGSWTEVPYLSWAINETLFTIQNTLRGAKNKVVKPHEN